MARARLLPLLAILAASAGSLAQQYGEYDYGYGYDFYNTEDDFTDDMGGGGATGGTGAGGFGDDDFYYDEYGYYGDEDEQYYEYYGYYADDFAGYEDYYSDEYDFFEECATDASGKPVLANSTASCDIKISGVNKIADKLTGGLDGVYKLSSCYNGKAMYKRADSPTGESRVLWYSSTFGDWDISKGSDPNEAEILMYGGEMEHASAPLFVSSWHLGADLKSSSSGEKNDYLPINVKVECADGKTYDKATYNTGTQSVNQPLLTEEEMEAKYRNIYTKYSRADPSPTINFTFVVLLVMTGLTIVLAIPYFLLKKKGAKGEKGQSVASSFSQMLQQSKKKHSGHIN